MVEVDIAEILKLARARTLEGAFNALKDFDFCAGAEGLDNPNKAVYIAKEFVVTERRVGITRVQSLHPYGSNLLYEFIER